MKRFVCTVLPCVVFAAVLLLCMAAAYRRQAVMTTALQEADSPTFVLDAGHGGEDGGATGVSGVQEAALNLQIALRLQDLMHLLGMKTSMIRTTDTAVYTGDCRTISEKKASDLKHRVELVQTVPHAILVSIHQNHFSESKYHGAQVFYAKTDGSRALAETMQSALAQYADPGNRRACKLAGSVYLMEHIRCPGILIECGFLSNYEEEQRLCSESYQKTLACVIAGTLLQAAAGKGASA